MTNARNGKGSIRRTALVPDDQVTGRWHLVYPRVECKYCDKMIPKKAAYQYNGMWVCESCCESLTE